MGALMPERLLLVEDKAELRQMLKLALQKAGFQVQEAGDGGEASRLIHCQPFSIILTDLKLPGCTGLELLRQVQDVDPGVPVIVMTAYGSIEDAVRAMKEGAYDFIQKPIDLEHLKMLLERALLQQRLVRENMLLKEEVAARYGFPRIIARHPSMEAVARDAQRVAATDSTVLLLGESGTGKELFARAIHQLSPRQAQPFVAINCAAIPEGLVENELFGHEKGAYTGAGARKIGKFELAHRGTIFLDEIAELPLAIQAKILRVIEERKFERVGGLQTIEVDVRIIVATNRDLRQAVGQKLFREDLYFRIAAVPIEIPPLRERGDDILELARPFVQQFAREFRKPNIALSREAEEALLAYDWPGNVRELQNTIERAVILADQDCIRVEDLNLRVPAVPRQTPEFGAEPFDWEGTLEEVTARAVALVERAKILQALKEARWNKAKAAEKLGVAYKTLLAKARALEQ
jgi:DNA-binding NtrC family response regulator